MKISNELYDLLRQFDPILAKIDTIDDAPTDFHMEVVRYHLQQAVDNVEALLVAQQQD